MLIFSTGEKFRSRIAPLTNWKPLIKVTGSPDRTRDALCTAFYALFVVFALFPRLEVSQARMLSTDFTMRTRGSSANMHIPRKIPRFYMIILKEQLGGRSNAPGTYIMQISNFCNLLLRIRDVPI